MRTKKVLGVHGSRTFVAIVLVLSFGVSARASAPDQVLEWIKNMNDTILAGGTSPLNSTRVVALVSSAVFDAVNGIEPRYEPLLVAPAAPKGTSRRAAAIEAAYAVLVNQYPARSADLTAKRDASLAALPGIESAKSIQNGITWGDTVANTILAIRSTDGFNPPAPPFEGVVGIAQAVQGTLTSPSLAVGVWRPTPTPTSTGDTGGYASGAGPQFASMTPWVLTRPSQFRLLPPYVSTDVDDYNPDVPAGALATYTNAKALMTNHYAIDYNELKTRGVLSGQNLNDDEKQVALFWAGNTPLFWNRIGRDLSLQRHLTLTQNAHLFALMNVAMADAGIACWDSKYRYVFWRPITAIRNGGTDNNPGTDPDPAWQPFLDSHPVPADRGTPAHPEYPSGHSTVSGAAAFILAAAFGENAQFTVISDAVPGVTRGPFPSFTKATDEIADARVFGGIHYRTSCKRGDALGRAVANYVSTHAMLRRDEDGDDE